MATKDPIAVTKLVATLRQYAPARVRSWDANDVAREIAVPDVRSRWTRVASTIEAQPWVRVELLNKHGAVLGYCDNDGVAGDVEDLAEPENTKGLALLNVMLKAQREALQFSRAETSELLKGCSELMKVVVEATRQLAGIYQAQVAAVAESAALRQDTPDDLDKMLTLVEAIPEIGTKALPFIAGLRGVLKGQIRPSIPGVNDAPKNGQPKG